MTFTKQDRTEEIAREKRNVARWEDEVIMYSKNMTSLSRQRAHDYALCQYNIALQDLKNVSY